jgi:hypothetical protein
MALSTAPPPTGFKAEAEKDGAVLHSGKLILIAILVFAAFCAVVLIFSRHWPFAEAPVLRNLREASDSQVTARGFRETYFPSPGCVLEGVVFHHGPSEANALITIETLTIQGSYSGLLTNSISRIIAQGMRVEIPPFGTGAPFHTTKSKLTIGEIVANGAAIDFDSKDPESQPLRFLIHEASLQNVGWSGPITYRLKVRNPKPPGEITTSGKFGIWTQTDAGETPISGEYKFEQTDLSIYAGIAGTLSSTGKFGGKLSHIDISGETDTPDFEVKSGRHPVRLTTQFSAYVDGTRGDVFLKRVDADFWKSHIIVEGSIAKPSAGEGKIAVIHLQANNARIEDLLRLFVKADRPPMSGNVNFRARAEIPSGPEGFLRKVKLLGRFGVDAGTFSAPSTQEGVNKLSADARGEKASNDSETVLTDLTGREDLLYGTATFTDLSFGVPGAAARLHGTYDLINEKIDLRGQIKLDTQISNTQNGPKALLLKAIQPFFKKKKKKEIVPVRISGTYDHPTFGLDLSDKKAQNVGPPSHKSSKAMPPPHHRRQE